jgi:hypothetical protein
MVTRKVVSRHLTETSHNRDGEEHRNGSSIASDNRVFCARNAVKP